MARYDDNERDASFSLTLRALAYLLRYPDAAWRGHLDEVHDALRGSGELRTPRLAQIEAFVDTMRRADEIDAQAVYVDLFDRGRGTALHLFEHVHGDSRERGPAMLDLIATYEQAGLFLRDGELPDHLTVLLEYASTQPRHAAVSLLGEVGHILRRIHGAVDHRGSAYAGVIGALLDIAGVDAQGQAQPIEPEPDLDEAWQEPAAFDGCANTGQQAAGQPQPVRIVRRAPATDSNAALGAAQGVRA